MVKTARCDPKKLRPEDFRKLELRVGKIRAVKKHGQFKGFFYTIYRLLRCNYWSRGGIDNVKS